MDMSLSEIATVKNFFSEHYGICDIQSNIQRIFRVSESFAPDHTWGSVPVWTAMMIVDWIGYNLRNKFLTTLLICEIFSFPSLPFHHPLF